MQLVLPTSYWAPRAWFEAYMSAPSEIEVWETYPKQTYRNRCMIVSPSGERLVLSVPVRHSESKQLTRDVEISYQSHWQHQHWNAILSAYKRTPYFDYYQEYLRPLYVRETRWLLDLNEQTVRIAEALLKNRRPDTEGGVSEARSGLTPAYTADWCGQDLERFWGDEVSILDTLFRLGPEAMIQAKAINRADPNRPQGNKQSAGQ